MESVGVRYIQKPDISDCIQLVESMNTTHDVDTTVLMNVGDGIDGYHGVLVQQGDDIVGFVVGYVSRLASVLSTPYSKLSDVVSLSAQSDVGYISDVVIHGDLDSTQITERLINDIVSEFDRLGVSILFESLVSCTEVVVEVLENAGFECILQPFSHQQRDLNDTDLYHGSEERCIDGVYIKQNELYLGEL